MLSNSTPPPPPPQQDSIRIVGTQRKEFIALLLVSGLVATYGFWIGPLSWIIYNTGNDIPNGEATDLSIWIGWLWLGIFSVTVVRCKKMALWLLLLAPFALFWPCMWIFVGRGCSLFGNCH
jgi:hypothetical protein